METTENRLRRNIKTAIIITIAGLLLNGISATFLKAELNMILSGADSFPDFLRTWFAYVNKGVTETDKNYPFMRYGFDWLAFAHLFIAIAFMGPLQDPLKNEWVVRWGMIVSAHSIVMALVWEHLRSVPFWWSCIDALIAVVAFFILLLCERWIQKLKRIQVVNM